MKKRLASHPPTQPFILRPNLFYHSTAYHLIVSIQSPRIYDTMYITNSNSKFNTLSSKQIRNRFQRT
ncbi:hypothetical protein BDV39DRAFT_169987 [Aspergillus sergii]|uniref:Uncharacterized protein n=1 Tax=Aspergillus sergii TaxID=1034303 RepID=A0A5N6XDA5_9EURO|nr:hypothetical protein BDV39DRAFT_169987 [Aspergillus sergii]